MKYSYEYKRKCVEMYRQGEWPETPDGIQERNFHDMIRRWAGIEKSCGPEALQHKNQNKVWTAEEKYELVAQVMAGASARATAITAGISNGLLYQRIQRYKIEGYEGLVAKRKGRPPKEAPMKKKIEPAELTPSEREELIRLRARVEYLEAENEVIKKRIALRREKWDDELKAKKQRSSKSSEKKDML